MKDFIQQAIRTESPPNDAVRFRAASNVRLLHAAMGMETEVGEMMDQLKKHIFYAKPLDTVNLKEELGDLLWYVAIACDDLGITIEQVMDMVILKLRARYPERFTEYDAQNRDLEKEREILEEGYSPEKLAEAVKNGEFGEGMVPVFVKKVDPTGD
jgi:NTP pyrophosphatase (non-canonical NTP hydrolase)